MNKLRSPFQAQNVDHLPKADSTTPCNASEEEAVYLTAAKLAIRLSTSRQTVYNLMGSVLKEGVHYFRGFNGRPLFKWKTIVELVEAHAHPVAQRETFHRFPLSGYPLSRVQLAFRHSRKPATFQNPRKAYPRRDSRRNLRLRASFSSEQQASTIRQAAAAIILGVRTKVVK